MNSRDYWAQREEEALRNYIRDEAEYDRQIRRIYTDMLDACQRDIESFYSRYAGAEDITIAEAKKRVSQADIAAYKRKAAKYVREKNFSEQANEEMRLYNATMRINRMEMLRANIGLELIAGHDELNNLMGEILQGRTMGELKRMSGILGKTVLHNTKKAAAIVNGSFHNGTFSDRIWQYQDMMREDLGKLLQQGLVQGKNPRALTKDLRKYLLGDKVGKGATYNVERLMRTELRRVQTEAQKQSFERNGFEMYRFHCNVNPSKSHTCDICKRLASQDKGFGKGIYLVKDMMPGTNAPPMHPNCRCSTSAYEDSDEYEAWLDYLDKGGTTAEWNASAKKEWKKAKQALENSEKSGTISVEDFFTGRSLGAKAKNYEVNLPNGEKVRLAEGTRVTNIQVIAGKGRNREIDIVQLLLNAYPGTVEHEWQKVKGIGYVDYHGENYKVNLHWYQEPSVGRVEWKVKPDADGNWFIYEDE
jgi:SPP1 gp7 family putative phage head morphogenesis protein